MRSSISIVGAGPSGLMAAIRLLEGGLRVTLFDPKSPWEKPCGGYVTAKGLREFPFFTDLADQIQVCREVDFESPDGEVTRVRLSRREGTISRFELSRYLLDKALTAGAELVPERVVKIDKRVRPYQLYTHHSTFTADTIIGADGATSVTRRSFIQKIPKREMAVACGYNLKRGNGEAFIIRYLKREGYIWVFPGTRHTSVGIYARVGSSTPGELFQILDRYLTESGYSLFTRERWSALIPSVLKLDLLSQAHAGDRWILVGDAAGYVDAVTGEGIYYALKSGELAAKVILEGNLSLYDELWRSSCGKALTESAIHLKNVLELGEEMGPATIGRILYNNSTYLSSKRRVSEPIASR